MSMLKEQFALLHAFLKGGFKKTVLLSTAGFIAAGIVGYIIGVSSPDTVETIITAFIQNVISSGVIQEDGSMSVFALLSNNWSAMLIAAAYGLLPFVFLPVLTIAPNGFLIGIAGAMYQLQNRSFALWLAGLLPHGIFEFPAFFLSTACGIYLCLSISRRILGRSDLKPLTETLCDLLRVMVLLVAPLTIAAAFIEVYITPAIMMLFR